MKRCPDCGAPYKGRDCPNRHTDDREARQPLTPEPVGATPYTQGEWVGYEVTIGVDHAEERLRVPAQVLGVSSSVVRLACYVSDAGRVIFVDAALEDLLPPVDPLEETTDGD